MSDCGKGSTQRPAQVPDEKVAEQWEAIFGKKEPKKETPAN